MKLGEYLHRNKITSATFAGLMTPAVSVRTVEKWRSGERRPRLPDVAKIEAVTDGAVKVSDFVEPEVSGEAA